MTLIWSNDDVADLLSMQECLAALEAAYVELAAGRGVTRTRSETLTPTTRNGALYGPKTMDGVVPKMGVGAARIDSDISCPSGPAVQPSRATGAPSDIRYREAIPTPWR